MCLDDMEAARGVGDEAHDRLPLRVGGARGGASAAASLPRLASPLLPLPAFLLPAAYYLPPPGSAAVVGEIVASTS
jgi:hypothetical protein